MSGFNLPPGVSAGDIPGNDFDDESEHQAMAVLTLRDYFAAKALLGFMCEPIEGVKEALFMALSDNTCKAMARGAYKMADAMIKAREVQS
jgi:hypothetical protein